MVDGELLLEVRVEEIPARMLPGAIQELGTRLFGELVARGLAPSAVDTAFTPRRLVVILRGLPARDLAATMRNPRSSADRTFRGPTLHDYAVATGLLPQIRIRSEKK